MPHTKLRKLAYSFAVAAAVTTLAAVSPTAAHAETPTPTTTITTLPGWDSPAKVTVQPDGSMIAEALPDLGAEATEFAALATHCGSACEGKNPASYKFFYTGEGPGYSMTCASDATTVRAVYEPGGNYAGAELRYSKRCRTAWTRWTANAQPISDIWVYSYTAAGAYRLNYFVPSEDSDVTNFTPMTDDANKLAAACYGYHEISGPAPRPYHKLCTTKY